MKNNLLLVVLFTMIAWAVPRPVIAQTASEDSADIKIDAVDPFFHFNDATNKDPRVAALTQFFESYDSPLAPYAATFVQKADEYQLPDWKLVPAITGAESTFGKFIPTNSYNAYGWVNGNYSFNSWEDSIDVVSKTLSENYYGKGADTVEKIAHIYCPPSNTWAGHVQFFMDRLQSFYEKAQLDSNLNLALAL